MAKTQTWTTVGSVLSAREGGISQSYVKYAIEHGNVRVRFGYSPYVGHYSVAINTANKRQVAKAERVLFG